MAQPSISIYILDKTHGQPVGAEIHAILAPVSDYQVYLVGEPLSRPDVGRSDARPGLIIPILPASSKDSAVKFLEMLQEEYADSHLLPVLRPDDLNDILDEVSVRARDFLVMPIRAAQVLTRVRRLLARKNPREGIAQTAGLARLIGEDPVFKALKQKLPLVARHAAPVLLTGETGTGKELCARALHYLSARAGKPYLPVNCGAIPVELFESELFGHQKGAFTGAVIAQTGLIEEAEGGTLFLDEIDSLSLAAQVKLLRFIENHTYHPLGSAKERHGDLWIIAATNQDLRENIRHGTFREDLFYRVAVITLSLPALRERKTDIPLLVKHFWSRYAGQREGEARQLSARAMEALNHYEWPGNIRELENVIHHLLVLTEVQLIEPEDLPIPLKAAPSPPSSLSFNQARAQIIAQFEKAYLMQLLQANQGNVTRAAKDAKKERRSLGRLIKKYQLDKR